MIVTTKDFTIEMTAEEALTVFPEMAKQMQRRIAGSKRGGRHGKPAGRGRGTRQGHGIGERRGEGRERGMKEGHGKRRGRYVSEESGERQGRRMERADWRGPVRDAGSEKPQNRVQLRRMRVRRRQMAMMRRAHRRGLRRGYRMGWQEGLQVGRQQGRMLARRRFMRSARMAGKPVEHSGRHSVRGGSDRFPGRSDAPRRRWQGGEHHPGPNWKQQGGRGGRRGPATSAYL